MARHHFYSSNPEIPQGYELIRIECYMPKPGRGFGVEPLYCFYNGVKHYYGRSAVPPDTFGRAPVHDTRVISVVLQPSNDFGELLEYYNAGADDHYYTAERVTPDGYSGPVVKGVVYPRPEAPRRPLYRFYNGRTGDHFYSLSAQRAPDYALEGVEGYVSAVRHRSWQPLRRFWNADSHDHFYAIDVTATPAGYVEEDPVGFVSPERGPGLARLHCFFNGRDHFYSLSGVVPPGYREETAAEGAAPIFVYTDAGRDREPWYQFFQAPPPDTSRGFFDWIGDAAEAVVSFVGDAGTAISDFFTGVLDTVEDVGDWIIDGIRGWMRTATEWLDEQSPILGWGGTILFGGTDGLLGGVQDVWHDAFDAGRDGVRIFGATTRLDAGGVIRAAGDLLLDAGTSIVDAVRLWFGGAIIGGIARAIRRTRLRHFVAELVDEHFAGADRDMVRAKIRLGNASFGYRLPAEHRVFALDSDRVPLRVMHHRDVLDLYVMAGYGTGDLGAHPRCVVKTVDENGNEASLPANRSEITSFLHGEGRLRVYAMSDRAIAEKLDKARRKLDELGIVLEWNDGTDFSAFRRYTTAFVEESDYDMPLAALPALLQRLGRSPGVNCSLLALGAFRISGHFGFCEGRNIREGEACGGRSDSCCSSIDRCKSSGVIYRDFAPTDVAKYVLPHEIGHFVGLCHYGHDGVHNVMYQPDANAELDVGLLNFYLESEPYFSLEDGKNAWRFLVTKMRQCFVPPVA